VFSLLSCCHGECGSQKNTGTFVATVNWAWPAISTGAVNLVADKGFPGQPWVRMGSCGVVVRRLPGPVR
jgi:hypothetical protein